ncbi:MAG: TolC family protein [Planctomycetaceae bacterium]|nr:TolC family protein [Planctomycetaceae bacterium]
MATVEWIPAFGRRRKVRQRRQGQEDQASQVVVLVKTLGVRLSVVGMCGVVLSNAALGAWQQPPEPPVPPVQNQQEQGAVVVPAEQLPAVPTSPATPNPKLQPQQQDRILGQPRQLLEPGVLPDPTFEELQSRLPESLREAIEEPSPELNPTALTLSDVIASVYRAYPTIEAVRLQRQVAAGDLQTSWGEFDTKILAETMSEPTGFYENYRNGIGVARNTWWGGYLATGYRIGRGDFQPWYKERETLDGGEFKLAYIQPLLQGRDIDPRRVAIFQNRIAQQSVEPQLQVEILQTSFAAASIYWDWLAAGRNLRVQQQLLALARQRVEQIRELIKAQRRAKVDELFNDVLIAQRVTKVIEAEQKLQQATFKLALYLRDEQGLPLVADTTWLPSSFPPLSDTKDLNVQQQIDEALDRRPELVELRLQSEHVQWDRRWAQNQTRGRLDFVSELSQDVGPTTSKNLDKQQFEGEFGLTYEYPWQLRKARGKLRSTAAKLQQIDQKSRLTMDKISLEVQSAIVALQRSQEVIEQLVKVVETQTQVLELQEIQFSTGRIDLIELNLQEQLVTNLKMDLINAQRDWFTALSHLATATGLDPLEQALRLETIPDVNPAPTPEK